MNEVTKISIVTPSYNQAQFLEDTIVSVLSQNYPNLEYIIIDGGSSDGSVDIIRKYEKHLKYWASEKDKGQADALNKGFSKTTGEIMAYINADDKYCPWGFKTVNSIFADCPDVEWLTSLWHMHWNENGDPTPGPTAQGYTKNGFYEGETLENGGKHTGWIQQESTFWRRDLWEKAGGYILEDLHYAMDFELWARFFEQAKLYGISVPLGGFREHTAQKTADAMDAYYSEAEKVLERYCGQRGSFFKKMIGIIYGSRKERVKLVGYDYDRGRYYQI